MVTAPTVKLVAIASNAETVLSLPSPRSTSSAVPYQRSDHERGGNCRLASPENDMTTMTPTGIAATSKPRAASASMATRNEPRLERDHSAADISVLLRRA